MTADEERRDAEARKYADLVADDALPAKMTFHWYDIFKAHKKGQRIGEAHAEAKAERLERELREAREARFVPQWQHDCDAALNTLALWVSPCPHCGRPAVQAALKEKE